METKHHKEMLKDANEGKFGGHRSKNHVSNTPSEDKKKEMAKRLKEKRSK